MPTRTSKASASHNARARTAPYPTVTTPPMEARLAEKLPADDGWQFEPKWDGFRCVAHKHGDNVDLRGRSGKSLNRFFPDVVALVGRLKTPHCVIDGELVIVVDGASSFEALQARLHPAQSRVAKLAADQPAQFILFDCLGHASTSLIAAPLGERRTVLEGIMARAPAGLLLSPMVTELRAARKWLSQSGRALDGVIAKRIDGPYQPGERAMLKVKRLRSADCVIGGFRYAAGTNLIGSLLLGLYDDDGLLHYVGFTSAFKDDERPALTKTLKPLVANVSFTGNSPGGPSRWSTDRTSEWIAVKPRLVAEITYDQITDNRFRHGTRLLRLRPDKMAEQCTFEQLRPAAPPAEIANLFGKTNLTGVKRRAKPSPTSA